MAILVAIGIGAVVYFGGKLSDNKLAAIVGGCDVKDGLSVIPLLGYLSCERGISATDRYTIQKGDLWSLSAQWQAVECNKNTDICSYEFTKTDSTTGITLKYRFCTDTCGSTQTKSSIGFLGTAQVGGRLEVAKGRSLSYVDMTYTPFVLFDYPGTGGRFRLTSATCDLKEVIDKDFCTSFGTCNDPYQYTSLKPLTSVNYLDKWVVAPIEYNFVSHPSYGQVYCTGTGKLYSASTLKFESGCYLAPGPFIGSADCCPGQSTSTQICDSFKWKALAVTTVQCTVDTQCPGQGLWIPNSAADRTVVKYACQAGKCVSTVKATECSDDFDCPSSQLCTLDQATGFSNCVGTSVQSFFNKTAPPPVKKGDGFIGWLKGFALSMLGVGIFLFIIVVAGGFFPPLMILTSPLRNPRVFIIVLVILTLILTVIFNIPVGNIIGGTT